MNENNAQLVTEEKGISDVVSALKTHGTKPDGKRRQRRRRRKDSVGENTWANRVVMRLWLWGDPSVVANDVVVDEGKRCGVCVSVLKEVVLSE